jgi:hypothetical protein
MSELKIITKCDRCSLESRYVDEGYLVIYDDELFFIDTLDHEGEPLPEDWWEIEREYCFTTAEPDDGYFYHYPYGDLINLEEVVK